MKTPYINLVLKKNAMDIIDEKYKFREHFERKNKEKYIERQKKKQKTKLSLDIGSDILLSIHDTNDTTFNTQSYFSIAQNLDNKQSTFYRTMKDLTTEEFLPSSVESIETPVHCFWCRHRISKNDWLIGCPVEYHNKKLYKFINDTSSSSKSKTVFYENISTNSDSASLIKTSQSKNYNFNLNNNSYYLTDGLFCSFQCCLAFIKDEKKKRSNSLYDESECLLRKIFDNIFSNIELKEAPHWRLLKQYGGNLSIEEFRDTFQRKEYIQEDGALVRDNPNFKSLGFLYEEKFVI